MVADLPEPARRYLLHAIAPGTPLWQSVEVSMVGFIKIGAWRRFTATQIVAAGRGYIWAATARFLGVPVVGYDRLSGGTGEMRWRLLDLLPVVSVEGPDVTRSAAGRLASEIALIPTGFAGATWTGGADADTATATWGDGDQQERVELHLGPVGELREVLMQRWGNPSDSPFARYPFGVTVGARTHPRWGHRARGLPRRVVVGHCASIGRRVLPSPRHRGRVSLIRVPCHSPSQRPLVNR
jgi:hypothetical protein